ncbi:MAG: two-component system response regulator [Deltaproteobacteria bacterium HGW-Deltaproteobacteria-15]|jgi:CheY-like chemotaxis protein|nr:MAG: two-component system response regulator [Deltaproteobacteria bacterium HGW-Deltaproteobacteria-15]
MIQSILVADDDLDFRLIIRLALEASGYKGNMHFVDDGLELMDFLNHRGEYTDSEIPDLIILDLNMPRKNGREALHEIKADPALTSIPIVILSVASSKEDLQLSRDFDCPFIRKPDSYSQWVNAMEALLKFYDTDDVKGDP